MQEAQRERNGSINRQVGCVPVPSEPRSGSQFAANDNDDGAAPRNVNMVGPHFQTGVGNPTSLSESVCVSFCASLFLCCVRGTVLDTLMVMKCVNCSKDLPQGSSTRRQFCNSVCRTESWRKQAERSAQGSPSGNGAERRAVRAHHKQALRWRVRSVAQIAKLRTQYRNAYQWKSNSRGWLRWEL